jgi:hypothetical protein
MIQQPQRNGLLSMLGENEHLSDNDKDVWDFVDEGWKML